MKSSLSFKRALALSACLAFSLGACSSHGGHRISSVGATGAAGKDGASGETSATAQQGPAGPQGATGPQGAMGPQGAQGEPGMDGNFNFGDAGMLATGGLIGPNGLGGTGLLANTGDPENSPELLSDTLVITGTQAGLAAGALFYSASIVDDPLPGGAPLVGTVVGVASNTGEALVQAGNGEIYLVDGLAAAPGDLITATIGAATPIGEPGGDTAIGVSILSPDQQNGDLLTLGAGSDGGLLTAESGLVNELTVETVGIAETDIIEPLLSETGGVTEVLPVGGVTETLPVNGGVDGLPDDLLGETGDLLSGDDDGGLVGGLLGGQ